VPKSLPTSPSIENLRNRAKTLLRQLRAGDPDAAARFRESHPDHADAADRDIATETGLSDAQWVIAREYGFESWAKLKDHVVGGIAPIEQAIRADDIDALRSLLDGRPGLASQTIQWAARPYVATLGWYIGRHGSAEAFRAAAGAGMDAAQLGADAFGFALTFRKMDMVDAILEVGVDPLDHQDALYQLTENLDADGVRWMLERGADPDYRATGRDHGKWTLLDNVIHTYPSNAAARQQIVRALIEAGAEHEDNALFDLLSGRVDRLRERIAADAAIVAQHFDIAHNRDTALEYGGQYGGAPLRQTTLLHHCAEYGFLAEARLLLDARADPNARAAVTDGEYSTHTPIYNAVATNHNRAYGVLELLIERGADVNARANIDMQADGGGRFQARDIAPLGFVRRFPNRYHKVSDRANPQSRTTLDTEPHPDVLDLLRSHGATE